MAYFEAHPDQHQHEPIVTTESEELVQDLHGFKYSDVAQMENVVLIDPKEIAQA